MSRDPLHDLGARVAAEQDRRLAQRSPDAGLEEILVKRVATRRRPVGRAPLRTAASLGAAGAVGLALGVLAPGWLDADEALKFTVGPASGTGSTDEVRDGDLRRWHEAGAEGVVLAFTDGSRIQIDAGGRGRVVRTDERGADVAVEGGQARVRVVPRAGGSWTLQAGPFLVEVKGTAFDVRWDPIADQLALDLFSGEVVLSGCGLGDGRTIEAGHAVLASCRTPSFEKAPIARAAPAGAPRSGDPAGSSLAAVEPAPPVATVAPAAVATATPAAPTGEAHPSGAPSARPDGSWRALARAGRYREAYESARAAGFAEESERAGATDLVLLADAARLAGHDGDARAGYLAARRRFPGTPAAARAAFALGRAAFQRGDAASAARWSETYLAEQPQGALAPAAVEVLLEATLRDGDPASARSAAARYLAIRPDGPHAKEARRLLGGAPQDAGQ